MALGGLLDKAKSAGADAASSAKGKTMESAKNAMAEVQGLEPVLKNSGFIIGDIVLTLSIPPGIKAVIEQTSEGQGCLDNLPDDMEGLTKLQASMVKGLKDAYAMEGTVNQYGLTIGQIEMEMTLPPKVHVHLNSQKSRAFS